MRIAVIGRVEHVVIGRAGALPTAAYGAAVLRGANPTMHQLRPE